MKAQPSLIESWKSQPEAEQRLLVRVVQDLDTAERVLLGHKIHVRRRCKLVNGFVVTCTGGQALLLVREDWVSSIESDEPIHAQSGSRSCV